MSEKPKKGKMKELAGQKKATPAVARQKSKSTPFYRADNFQLYMLWIAMTFLLTLFIVPSLRVKISSIEVGDISSKNIKATMDFSVEDQETTIDRRDAAERAVLPVYDYNNSLRSDLVEKIHAMLRSMRDFYQEKNAQLAQDTNAPKTIQDKKHLGTLSSDKSLPATEKDWEQEWGKFAQANGINLDYDQYLIFEEYNFDPEIENWMVQGLNEVMKKGIVPSYTFSFNEPERGLIWRNVSTQTETKIEDINQILDLEGARKQIESRIKDLFPAEEPLIDSVYVIIQGLISPNLTFNLSETRARMELARESVKPAFFQIKKGEMIIREGERAKQDQVEKLNALMEMQKGEQLVPMIFGLVLIVGLTLMILFILLRRFRPNQVHTLNNLTRYLSTTRIIKINSGYTFIF